MESESEKFNIVLETRTKITIGIKMMVPEVSTKDKITIGENFKRESGNPIYIPHCCAVSCGLPTRLVTP